MAAPQITEKDKFKRDIYRKMIGSFSLDELAVLAFEAYISFDELPRPTLKNKAQDMIEYADRHGLINMLHTALQEARPHVEWPSLPQDVNEWRLPSNKHLRDEVHKYSGTWQVESIYSQWRGKVIENPDSVIFNGRTILIIPIDGVKGSGVEIGHLTVKFEDYHAIYHIVNEVQNAFVDKFGILNLHFKSFHVSLIKELPSKDDDPKGIYDDLRLESKKYDFKLKLTPEPDKPSKFLGSHIYRPGQSGNQVSSEIYTHRGLLEPPDLSTIPVAFDVSQEQQ